MVKSTDPGINEGASAVLSQYIYVADSEKKFSSSWMFYEELPYLVVATLLASGRVIVHESWRW